MASSDPTPLAHAADESADGSADNGAQEVVCYQGHRAGFLSDPHASRRTEREWRAPNRAGRGRQANGQAEPEHP